MKQIFLSLLAIIFATFLAAQAPQAINYQAIARDLAGNPITKATIGVQFRILQGEAFDRLSYAETFTATTNQHGLFNLQIGRGTPTSGTFAGIDWGNPPCFLEVAIDPAGGREYKVVGTSEMLSVPYALATPCPGCTGIYDGDQDTWVETDPSVNGQTDLDEIHMSLGLSPLNIPPPGVPGPTVLILRRNDHIPGNTNPNVMLEIIDPSGGENTFVGRLAGEYNRYLPQIGTPDQGELNTAFGSTAFQYNTEGRRNTALGHSALNHNTVGGDNTAVGKDALQYNIAGSNNTAVGVSSLVTNNTGNANTAIGQGALATNNAGDENTATGYLALNSNITGDQNTAVGANALRTNAIGANNTATGYDAMRHTIGGGNTANGFQTLLGDPNNLASNTGNFNTAIGMESLLSNTSGSNNTAVGRGSLLTNTTGTENTAIGVEALRNNIGGGNNAANGKYALRSNTTGNANTANGTGALQNNTTGDENTASGAHALSSNITGKDNTAIGTHALAANTTGYDNTAIGFKADVGPNNLHNATAIGANAKVMTNDDMILGDPAVNVGIGLSGDPAGPANKLEINSDANSPTASGLRFTKLAAVFNPTLDPLSSPVPTALSVDANGDVVLVDLSTLGGGGGNEWKLAGNVIIPGTDFLGTMNPPATSAPLQFKVNQAKAGIIDMVGQTFLGFEAGNINTAQTNTGIGYRALQLNASGGNNTATGYQSLLNNTGSDNTAMGLNSLLSNRANSRSTAIGVKAMQFADNRLTGRETFNTALGYEALSGNANSTINYGRFNTALGDQALWSNTTADSNTAVGYRALYSNRGGTHNTATGAEALYTNNGGSRNTANGYKALTRNTASDNTAMGAFALASNIGNASTGYRNTATGSSALRLNTLGFRNTANGYKALDRNTTANDNTATGASALQNNQTIGAIRGESNTANGSLALLSNTTGSRNTAVGRSALQANITASDNTATGYYSLLNNTIGFYNTANGAGALEKNNIGSSNTATGWQALYNNLDGVSNAANGVSALTNNTSGQQNTAVGRNALLVNKAGSNNTAIGYNAGPGTGLDNLMNTTCVGAGATVMTSNTMLLGNNTVNVGIGLSANAAGPTNKLEIDANSNNASGLTFRSLTSNSPASATSTKVLSVDLAGKVILVNAGTGGGGVVDYCTVAPPLTADAGTNLNGNNFYFQDLSAPNAKGNVGIGQICGSPLLGKLHVTTIQSNPLNIHGIYANTRNNNNAGIGIGMFSLSNGTASQNYGLFGQADGGTNNFAVFGSAASTLLTGTNYGVYGVANNAPNNYGVYGSVNSTTPTNWAGWFNGNVHATGTITSGSDAKLKKGRSPIENAIGIINQLNPQTYHFKTGEYAYLNLPEEKQYGLIAQEVESVLPEVVRDVHHPEQKDAEGKEISPALDFKALNYNAFIPILIQGVKEQQAQIEALKAQNEQMNQQSQSLQTQLDEMRAEMQSFRAALGQRPADSKSSSDK